MRSNVAFPRSSHLKHLLLAYPPQQTPRYIGVLHERYVTDDWHYPFFIMNDILHRRYNTIMAAKGTRRRAMTKKGEYTFVRMNLNAAEKAEAKEWCEKSADMLDAKLKEVLMAGNKCSFSYNETNDQVTCCFTGKPEESINEFRMLTSFASSWWQSLAVNLWKYEAYFKSGVWEDISDENDFG